MIYNVTYSDRSITEAINDSVGKPFGLIANLKKGGIGSEPFTPLEVNDQMKEYTGPFTILSKINLELRPNGIIIHFSRNRINFAWPIPYHHLTVFQNGDETTIYHHTDFIRFKPKIEGNGGRKFIQKMLNEKNQYLADGQLPN